MKKRLLSGLLSGIMMLSALTCVPALAASNETPPVVITENPGEPVPHDEIPLKNNVPITGDGIYWVNLKGLYKYILIEIDNTANNTLRGTLELLWNSPSAMDAVASGTFYVANASQLGQLNCIAPKSKVTLKLTSIPSDRCDLSLVASDRIYSGTVYVEASTTPY